MKKEVVFVITLGLFIVAYALDYFAGSLNLVVTSPLFFLRESYFKLYPMTFVAVVIRSVAIMLSVTLILSIMERQYLKKALISLVLGFVAEIYAFQILATSSTVTPVLWTLAISYAGVLLLIPIIVYILLAIYNFLIPQTGTELKVETDSPKSSVLNP
ncbi:MAG: hypothetical protein QY322_04345 [bacterium]|nr:MAG: hypothetical protein QY322_04345 [bacterium]